MKNIIQSLWIGNKIGAFEELSIKSFLKHKQIYKLYCYDTIQNLPDGVQVEDANEILPFDKIPEFYKKNLRDSYAAISDLFRYLLLYKKGNFWVDTDIVCLKPFDFQQDIVFCRESYTTIGTAVLKFPAKNTITKAMVDLAMNPLRYGNIIKRKRLSTKFKKLSNKLNIKDLEWGSIAGPLALTRILKENNLFENALPFNYFYPISFYNWDSIFDSSFPISFVSDEKCYAIHLWNQISSEYLRNPNSNIKSIYNYLHEEYC